MVLVLFNIAFGVQKTRIATAVETEDNPSAKEPPRHKTCGWKKVVVFIFEREARVFELAKLEKR